MRTKMAAAVAMLLASSLLPHPSATGQSDVEVFELEPQRSPVRAANARHEEGSVQEVPRRQRSSSRAATGASPQRDPLLDEQTDAPTRAMSAPSLNFDGQAYSGVVPSDVVGDVGPDHYVQMINASGGSNVAIYNKADGTPAASPFTLDTLAPTGTLCADGKGDPIVLYDHFAGRWLLTEFTNTGNTMCLYVSSGSNPATSTWLLYPLTAPNFPDYPKWAVWQDSYLIGTNEHTDGSPAYAIDRSEVLAGVTASAVRLTAPYLAGFPFQLLTPVDIDGPNLPAAGSPGIFVRHNDDEAHSSSPNGSRDLIEIWELDVDWSAVTATLVRKQSIAVAEFDSSLCGLVSFECFDQPGGGGDLDSLREPVMWRPVFRVLGGQHALVGSFVTDVDGTDRGGVRWFELRRSSSTTSGGWALRQEGTYAPNAVNRWMSSIAIDKAGGIALGYNVVSESLNVPAGIRYTGRLRTDPLGVMTATERTIRAGAGTQSHFRWGDYSSMNIDPIDGCTFWYTNNYVASSNNWQTRIARFAFDECLNPPKPKLRISDVRLTEGDPTSKTSLKSFRFKVTRDRIGAGTSVRLRTKDATARAGSDYVARNILVSFGPSQKSKVVEIKVKRDTRREPNERFRVRLLRPTNAVIADGVGVGTIVNDD